MWTFLIALVLLNGGTILECYARRLGAPSRLDLNVLHPHPAPNAFSQNDLGKPFVTGCLSLLFSFWYVKPDFTKLYPEPLNC